MLDTLSSKEVPFFIFFAKSFEIDILVWDLRKLFNFYVQFRLLVWIEIWIASLFCKISWSYMFHSLQLIAKGIKVLWASNLVSKLLIWIVRNCKIFLSRPNFCWYMVIRLQEIVKINFAKALPAYEICYYEFKDVIICMNESKIEKPCFILFIEISSTYFINVIILQFIKPYFYSIKGTTVKLV